MTTDRSAFLRAIVAAPDDDLPRLQFADFLEDTARPAEPEYAEFIRVQCSIACRLPENGGRGDAWKLDALRRRERRLLVDLWPSLRSTLPEPYCRIAGYEHWAPHRGFISRASLTWEEWLASSQAILDNCPIARARDGLVRLTTWPVFQSRINPEGLQQWRRPNQARWRTSGDFGIGGGDDDQEACEAALTDEAPGVRFELPSMGMSRSAAPFSWLAAPS
jgi:uncharacterized protein (TIGR02996 family)